MSVDMRRVLVYFSVIFCALAIPVAALSNYADYLYCEALGADENTYYITNVFKGDYSDSSEHGAQFTYYLVVDEGNILLKDGTCGFISTENELDANTAHAAYIADLKAKDYEVSVVPWESEKQVSTD